MNLAMSMAIRSHWDCPRTIAVDGNCNWPTVSLVTFPVYALSECVARLLALLLISWTGCWQFYGHCPLGQWLTCGLWVRFQNLSTQFRGTLEYSSLKSFVWSIVNRFWHLFVSWCGLGELYSPLGTHAQPHTQPLGDTLSVALAMATTRWLH